MTLLLSLAILLMLFGISLIFYAGVLRPTQLRAAATATVQGIQTASAHAASATAQANAAGIATSTEQAQATATALQALYIRSTSGPPVLDDALNQQSAANWDIYNAQGGGGCAFSGGALHASVVRSQFYVPCFAHATNFSSFAFEAQVEIQKGDEAGLIFRANDAISQFYVFSISKAGMYSLLVSKDDKHSTPLIDDACQVIKTGNGQINILTVIAQGDRIDLYINRQFVNSVHDNSYASGEIGVFAGSTGNITDVAFNRVRVWNL
jgi:hypothetical protein